MKPIVLYFRVSTTDQNIDSQISDLRVWAKQNHFKVIKQFGETVSGYDLNAERKEYEKMKDYVLKNNIKDIAVWEISRLSRSMINLVNEIDFYTKNNINIHFKKENLESLSNNATNKLLLQIMGAMAEMERNTFIERGARGRMAAVKKGKMIGYSTPPYGYKRDKNGIMAIEPKEAETIKMIFDLYAKGYSLYSISEKLNSLKIPTRRTLQGKKRKLNNGKEVDILWKPSPISRMLKKTIYKGVRVYKGEKISVPAIVSEKLWNKVQQNFKNNIGYVNKTKYEYLFKGKMICGKCGRTIVTYKLKNSKYSYYCCTGIVDKNIKCDNGKYINSPMIDNNLYPTLFNHKYINQIMQREASRDNEINIKKEQIIYYNKEINTLRDSKKRNNNLYTKGYISFPEYESEIAKLNNKIIENENLIKVLNNEIETLSQIDIDKVLNVYKGSNDYNVKRDFVNKYVNKIIVYKIDNANVNWKYPLHKNEKIIYVELYAFSYEIPLKILLTPYSKNVIVSESLQYLNEYNMITDIKKGANKAPKNKKN